MEALSLSKCTLGDMPPLGLGNVFTHGAEEIGVLPHGAQVPPRPPELLRELVEDVAVARELLGDGRGGGGGGGAAAHGVVDVLQLAEQRLDLELHGLPGGAVGGGGGGARGGGGGGARGEARVGGELYVEVALQLARLPPQLLPPGLLQLQRRCRRIVRRRHHRLRRRRRLGSDRIQSAVI